MAITQTIDGFNLEQEKQDQEKLINKILSQCQSAGASSAEVSVSKSASVSVRSRLKEVETLQFKRGCDLSIGVYIGQKQGRASTSDFSEEALKACIANAIDIAKYTAEDPYAGLADANHMAKDLKDLQLDFPAEISTEQAIEQSLACEVAGLDSESRISNSEGASFGSYRGIWSYGNTHGFLASSVGTQHSMSCTLIAKDTDNTMKRNGWYSVAREFGNLESPQAIGKKAAELTVKDLGARKVKTCKVPVIFSAEIASGLLGHFFSAIGGGNLYRKSSFLLDALGKPIFPNHVQIIEKPHKLKGFASSMFDNEGVATYEHAIVQDGLLESYVLNSYSARRLGLKTTANAGGLRNVEISHSGYSLEDLFKQIGTGVLVTSVMGQGVNIVTGDYSRGADGFWIENGEIQYPLHEFTIAGNLKDMYQNISVIGNDLDHRSSTLTGSIVIEDMMVAGDA
ncbi:MAG: metalloprotease PmbA [Pseudomonadota bacterium]